MLLTRLITAIILIPLAVLAIFKMPPLYFAILTGLLILVGAWEWALLVGFQKPLLRCAYVFLVALGLCGAAFLSEVFTLFIALFLWVWFFVAIVDYQRHSHGVGFEFSSVRFISGFFILVASWVALMTLKTHPSFGPAWLMTAMLLIWSADIGAYFAGRFLGKHPLCSRVSPKKTWEGLFGGMVLSLLTTGVCGLFLSLSISQYFLLLGLAFITGIFSVVGDLGVSLLKRMSGLKDSGKFFPGHGGMLDRLDSIASATVVFVLGALLLGL